MLRFVVLFCLTTVVAHGADTPDYDREARIAEQIEPQIFDGEAVWLNDGERAFLSIHMEADEPKGAVLLLHGRDVNPEDLNVVGPMRVGLVDEGWSTLALQMPVLEKGHKYDDYLPILGYAHGRIEAGIAWLGEQGYEVIVLAGHSCGAHMAHHWLSEKGDDTIQGYVAMGAGATDYGQTLKTPFPFADMSVPILDIYGSEEFPRPLAMVAQRAELLRMNANPASTQVVVEGADHYFHDHGEDLTAAVADWLNGIDF